MSQKKRLIEKKKREEALKKAEQNRKTTLAVGVAVAILIVAVIAGALIFDYERKNQYTLDYSAGLTADGKIKGIDVNNYVELCNFNAMNMNAEDYYPSEDEEKQYIESLVASYPDLDNKEGVAVKEGDLINIDFVGTVDGKEYEGGNTNLKGTRLTLGSAGFPEGFEEGIIGHKTGETFDVNVDIPETFDNEEIAGKTVKYTITINGLYKDAVFNDEFVKKNFGMVVDGADDFLNRYRMNIAETEFNKTVCKYAVSESVVTSYPASYLKKIRKYMVAKDYKQMETTNDTYKKLYNGKAYNDVLEMRGMTKAEYKAATDADAKELVKNNLVYQALFEKYGLTVTSEDLNAVTASYGFGEDEYADAVERFGEPYLYQQAMIKAVDTYLADYYNLPE